MIPERTYRVLPPERSESESLSRNGSRSIKILVYHRIVRGRGKENFCKFCLSEDEFRRHLEWLDRWGFTPITFEDYRIASEKQLELPHKPIILTFDDGYLDTYQVAFPLLKEFGMKAVIFVLGDRTIKNNVWDAHLNLLQSSLLEDSHILEMHEAGMEIGAHSMTHLKLTDVKEERAWEEISRARMLLEILLNAPVLSFSYPYGLVNETVKHMVASAGFTHACSVWTGPAVFGKDAYELRRIPILNSTTTSKLAVRVSSLFQYYSWMRWTAGKILRRKHPGYENELIAPLDSVESLYRSVNDYEKFES
ncbi:MAG: polysaccharide deacetylase family protein [Bacteroidota bacterium]|nr:polysaccharide deacetylase family protein [Bacteroidota bacterium]